MKIHVFKTIAFGGVALSWSAETAQPVRRLGEIAPASGSRS
ncbi:MAG: hypothetical protein NTV97_22635 [Alphaproteobacteria bacterium]|nr:hypothetical protein [Alphaproteobacteria bacterium]